MRSSSARAIWTYSRPRQQRMFGIHGTFRSRYGETHVAVGWELSRTDILHVFIALHHLFDDKCICANERARKGMEVWHVLHGWQHRACTILVPHFQEMGHRNQHFLDGMSKCSSSTQSALTSYRCYGPSPRSSNPFALFPSCFSFVRLPYLPSSIPSISSHSEHTASCTS